MINQIVVLLHPVNVFEKLRGNEVFPIKDLLITLLIMLISLIINAPIKEKCTIILLSSMNLPDDQISNMITLMYKMRVFQILSSEFIGLGLMLLYSLTIMFLVFIFRGNMSFKKIFHLLIIVYPIIILGDIINSGLIYFSGIDNLTSQYDTLMFGMNKITSETNVGIMFYTFLSYMNVFQFVFLVVLYKGIKYISIMSRKKSFMVCFIVWFISSLIPTLSIFVSDILRDKASSIF